MVGAGKAPEFGTTVLYSWRPSAWPMHVTPIPRTRPARQGRVGFGGVIVGHWKGRHGLLAATVLPCVVLLALWGLFTVVFDSVDWVWHHRLAAAASLLLIALLMVATVWGAVGVARSARRADDQGESVVRVYGAAGLVMACAIGTVGQFGFATRVWLASLSTLALDQGPRSEIRAEPALGRMVIRGELGLGTTRRVRDALLAAPWVRLVELDSPGGSAVEGLALSKLLEARGVDTLVLRSCGSACITAFAAGGRRYLGPKGRLGFHSASAGFRNTGRGLDDEHARVLERRGVARWLIDAERETPNGEILEPGPAALLGSGLVTDLWGGSR